MNDAHDLFPCHSVESHMERVCIGKEVCTLCFYFDVVDFIDLDGATASTGNPGTIVLSVGQCEMAHSCGARRRVCLKKEVRLSGD